MATEQPVSELRLTSISDFLGVDLSRDLDSGTDMGVGQVAENMGRSKRNPLEPRMGLRPVKSENGNHEVAASSFFGIGAMPHGARLNIVMRLDSGRLIAATGVTRE